MPLEKTMAEKVFDEPNIVAEPELNSQPFYLPEAFSFEKKFMNVNRSI